MIRLEALKDLIEATLLPIIENPQQRTAERNQLLAHFLEISIEQQWLHPDLEIHDEDAAFQNLRMALSLRVNERLPIQYLLKEAAFMGRSFHVTPAVLIPRPETELLVEAAIEFAKTAPVQNAIDLGTGSGCIAVSLKAAMPSLVVSAVDISHEALDVAQANAKAHHAEIEFYQGSWFEPVPEASFDLILSNPPYIAPEDRTSLALEVLQEPAMALFTPDSPERFFETLLMEIQAHLRPSGLALVEIAMGQGPMVKSIAQSLGFSARLIKDYGGIERILRLEISGVSSS